MLSRGYIVFYSPWKIPGKHWDTLGNLGFGEILHWEMAKMHWDSLGWAPSQTVATLQYICSLVILTNFGESKIYQFALLVFSGILIHWKSSIFYLFFLFWQIYILYIVEYMYIYIVNTLYIVNPKYIYLYLICTFGRLKPLESSL